MISRVLYIALYAPSNLQWWCRCLAQVQCYVLDLSLCFTNSKSKIWNCQWRSRSSNILDNDVAIAENHEALVLSNLYLFLRTSHSICTAWTLFDLFSYSEFLYSQNCFLEYSFDSSLLTFLFHRLFTMLAGNVLCKWLFEWN